MTNFTTEEIKDIAWGDNPDFVVIEDGDWINEYKDCDVREVIVQQQSTGKYFRIDQSRSGSYYSDYEYDDPKITEVAKIVKRVEAVSWEEV